MRDKNQVTLPFLLSKLEQTLKHQTNNLSHYIEDISR